MISAIPATATATFTEIWTHGHGFFETGPPPVYIGFGSVIVKDPVKFTHMILEAAEMARCR